MATCKNCGKKLEYDIDGFCNNVCREEYVERELEKGTLKVVEPGKKEGGEQKKVLAAREVWRN